MPNKLFIMLGRTGDVLNILPALWYEFHTNKTKPALLISKDYYDVTIGCRYFHPVIFNGDFRDVRRALELARFKFPDHNIIDCSVYGFGLKIEKTTDSFQLESWKLSQCPVNWGELDLRFDARDQGREERLLRNFLTDGRPIIITSLSGISSNYKGAGVFFNRLKSELPEVNIIDISELRAERIYDLLALYEVADLLIAIDSAPLHLANAVPDLPVISLVSDRGKWYESARRKNHVLRLRYDEINQNFDKLINTAKKILNK